MDITLASAPGSGAGLVAERFDNSPWAERALAHGHVDIAIIYMEDPVYDREMDIIGFEPWSILKGAINYRGAISWDALVAKLTALGVTIR